MYRVLHAAGLAAITKTPRQTSHQTQAKIRLAKQHPAGVRRDPSAVESSDDLASSVGRESEAVLVYSVYPWDLSVGRV